MKRPPIIGMALALLGGLLGGLLLLRGGGAPELTTARLEEARQQWERSGPSSYVLVVQMGGALTDRRRISVRGDKVVEMTIEDRPATESSWAYWSVDGMLDFLEAELENAREPPPTLGVSDPSQIVLRARFDPDLGYPTHFLRHILGRQQSTEWEVVSFETAP